MHDNHDDIEPTEDAASEELVEVEADGAITRKMKLSGTVKKLTLAGAIVDIGQDRPGMLHISRLQVEPVNRVEDVLEIGQTIEVWVRRIDPKSNRIELTMIKPLELEWREIKKGMVVKGKVTRLETFGVFVEIGAERPGLVHISELTHGYIRTPSEMVKEGDEVEVMVIGVNRRKKRIRLSMKALVELPDKKAPQVVEDDDDEEESNEPVPTAMEIALRQAMDRNKGEEAASEEKPAPAKRKSSRHEAEMEDILNRTLEQEVRT
jgi:ribosomal protein S1